MEVWLFGLSPFPSIRPCLMQEVLTDSLAMEWTPAQAALLRQTEGVESVVEAVRRTATAKQVLSCTYTFLLHLQVPQISESSSKCTRRGKLCKCIQEFAGHFKLLYTRLMNTQGYGKMDINVFIARSGFEHRSQCIVRCF